MLEVDNQLKTPLEFIDQVFSCSLQDLEASVPPQPVNSTLIRKSLFDAAQNINKLPKVTAPLPYLSHPKYKEFPSPTLGDIIGSSKSLVLDQVNNFSLTHLADQLNLRELTIKQAQPKSLLVLGLKNPFYIYGLIDWAISNKITQIAFVDTDIRHLYESFFLIDWEDIFKRLKDNGLVSTFFFDDTLSNSLANSINWFSMQKFYSSINFYYFIDRVFNAHCQPAIVSLKEPMAYASLTSMGFFEDNVNMVVNTFNSFASNPRFYSKSSKCIANHIFLVGSGPSFDDTIDEIKFLKKKFNPTIICCGSAVTSMIESGILPDFVVLVERNESVYIKHRDNPQYHKAFKEIDLISASTVDHRIFDFYRSVHLYSRSSNIFASDLPQSNILSYTHTTSANAGLSFALSLNPEALFLYGLDFGSHIRSYTRQKSAHGVGSYNLNKPVRGRHGTMFSNSALLRSKSFFDQCLLNKSTSTVVYNRSNSPNPDLSSFVDFETVSNILSLKSSYLQSVDSFSSPLRLNKLSFSLLLEFIHDFVPSPDSPSAVTELYTKLTKAYSVCPEFKVIVPFIKSICLTLSCAEDILIYNDGLDARRVKDSCLHSYKHSLKNIILLATNILNAQSDLL